MRFAEYDWIDSSAHDRRLSGGGSSLDAPGGCSKRRKRLPRPVSGIETVGILAEMCGLLTSV